MNTIYLRFPSKADMDKALRVTNLWYNPDCEYDIVGQIVLTPAIIDWKNGTVDTEAVLSKEWHLNILPGPEFDMPDYLAKYVIDTPKNPRRIWAQE